jgi:hypothetical protein
MCAEPSVKNVSPVPDSISSMRSPSLVTTTSTRAPSFLRASFAASRSRSPAASSPKRFCSAPRTIIRSWFVLTFVGDEPDEIGLAPAEYPFL